MVQNKKMLHLLIKIRRSLVLEEGEETKEEVETVVVEEVLCKMVGAQTKMEVIHIKTKTKSLILKKDKLPQTLKLLQKAMPTIKKKKT